MELKVMQGTIAADIITNKQFLVINAKVTLGLLLFIMFLKLLPNPLIITSIDNDPTVLMKEICDDVDCQ